MPSENKIIVLQHVHTLIVSVTASPAVNVVHWRTCIIRYYTNGIKVMQSSLNQCFLTHYQHFNFKVIKKNGQCNKLIIVSQSSVELENLSPVVWMLPTIALLQAAHLGGFQNQFIAQSFSHLIISRPCFKCILPSFGYMLKRLPKMQHQSTPRHSKPMQQESKGAL